MRKFEILEHKADLKIKVFGKTKKELFENALVGMFESARYEALASEKEVKRKIKISSLDLPSLLVDFLSEVLFFCETKQEVYNKIKIKKISEKEIEGILIGKKLKRMGVHIKAVTYHDLKVVQKKDGTFEATVLFDI